MTESGDNLHESPGRSVAIYRTAYPHVSEAFIAEQLAAIKDFGAVLICRDLLQDADLGVTCLQIRGKITSLLFKVFGRVPSAVIESLAVSQVKLVHAHFASDGIDAVAISRALHVPLVVTCHGSDITRSFRARLFSGRLVDLRTLLFWRRLLGVTSAFIAVSDFLANRMVQRGIPRSKIIRHYIGVDVERITPKRRRIAGQSFIFLSVARHENVKGVDTLLEAFSRVAERVDVRLVQVGSGSLTSKIQAQISELRIQDKVSLLGALSHEGVIELLGAVDCVVLSSRQCADGSEEAFGISLVEAAAAGLPTVGTKVGGIPEAMIDGCTGILVEPDDPIALSDAMCRMVVDREAYAKMSTAAREMACSTFDIRVQTRALEDIYASLLQKGAA